MAHARQTVRDAVLAAVSDLTTTGESVFASPAYVLAAGDLPALRVWAAREGEANNDPVDEMGTDDWRALTVEIEAVARTSAADTTVLDVLDTICAEVEAAVMADTALGALVHERRLQETVIEIDGEAEEPTGTARMTWVMAYATNRLSPTTVTT